MLINKSLPTHNNTTNHIDAPQPQAIKVANLIIILVIVLATAISTAFRAYYTTPVDDDIIYSYILGPETQANAPVIGQVTSVYDAIQSQINQYLHCNGRFLVHIVLQSICGLSPQTGFALFCGILIASVLVLLILFAIPATQRLNPVYWLIAAFILLYLFPGHSTLWFSRALCCNYLLPMCLVLSWLVLYRHWRHKISSWRLLLLSLLGFCTGFSHECFALTLSGGLFIYALRNLKKIFTISSIPILCMWVGTILVVVSPGNFQRQGGEISGRFINFIHLLPHLSILYLSLAIVVISYLLNKSIALNVTRNKAIIWWSLLFAILFGIIANTGLWSLTGVEFYAAILLISYLPSLSITCGRHSVVTIAFCAICTVLLSMHLSAIVKGQIKQYDAEQSAIESFKSSTCGLASFYQPHHSDIISPYIMYMAPNKWNAFSLSLKYDGCTKPFIFAGPDDMSIIRGDKSMSRLLIPGSAAMYKGNYNLWTKTRDNDYVNITLQRLRQPVIDMFRSANASDTFIWTAGPLQQLPCSDSLRFIFPYSSHTIISADME